MSLLTHQSFANDTTPYWLSNPVSYIQFAGTPPVDVSASGGELYANGVSLSPSTWYNYPANGVIQIDSSDVIQIISNDLYFNNQLIGLASNISNVSDWYLYPAVSGNVELNTGVGVDFDGTVLSKVGSELQFGTTTLNASRWSTYPAISTVNLSNFTLSNVSNITGSNISNVADTIRSTSITNTITANSLNPFSNTRIFLNAKNGTGGQIDLQAESSVTGSLGGRIGIVAKGGNTGGLVYGGEVEITAETGGILPTGFTSAIKLSAASVLSYAGAVSPFGSLAGYNFVYGTGGVNIVAGTPPLLPNVAGSVYLTGDIGSIGSTGGVRIKNGLSVDWIVPISDPPTNPDLRITGNPAGQKVQLSNVRSLAMEGDITGLGNLTMTGNVNGVGTLTMNPLGVGALSNVQTINGFPYNPVRNWANFPAIGNVDLSGNNLTRVGQLTTLTGTGGIQQNLGFLGIDISCIGTIDNGLSNGNFRCRELVLSLPSSYPAAVASDLKVTNISNTFDAKQRVGVVGLSTNEVVAYVSDIPNAHGIFYSTVNQSQALSNVPHPFTYNGSNTVVGLSNSGSQVFSLVDGSFVGSFSIQFARTSGGGATIAEAWIRKNGIDVPDTNTRVLLAGGGNGETVMTVPFNIDLSSGEWIEVVMGTPDYTTTIAQAFAARTTPYTAPAIPSIIFTLDQVG